MAEEETFSLDFRYNFGGSFTLDIWPEILDFGLVAEEETFSLDFRHNFGGSFTLDIWPEILDFGLVAEEETFSLDFRHNFGGSSLDIWDSGNFGNFGFRSCGGRGDLFVGL